MAKKKVEPEVNDVDAELVTEAEIVEEPEQSSERPAINGVLVHRIRKDNGDIQCIAEVLGDVVATEVDTVLLLGRKEFRKRLELDE